MEFVYAQNLVPHVLSERVYGSPSADAALLASIEKVGVLCPIIVDRHRTILSGHRRWSASKKLAAKFPARRFDEIPVIVFRGSDLEAERIVIESNRQRVKTAAVLAREAAALLRIEGRLASERLKKGRPCRKSDKGRASARVACQLGIGREKVEQAAALLTLADAGNRAALRQMRRLESGTATINSAYLAVVKVPAIDSNQTGAAFSEDLRRLESRVDAIERRCNLLPELARTDRARIQSAANRLLTLLPAELPSPESVSAHASNSLISRPS
jgi:ParB-like chromosome segregation protein Spo0J